MIVAAAIKFGGMILSMPKPARHHTILHQFAGVMGAPLHTMVGESEQGFLNHTGEFMDRERARELVVWLGQPLRFGKLHHDRELFSEDLW